MNQVLHVIFMPVLESYNNHLGVVLKALSYTEVRQIMRVKRHCDSSHALWAFGQGREQKTGKCSETAFPENRYQMLAIFSYSRSAWCKLFILANERMTSAQ